MTSAHRARRSFQGLLSGEARATVDGEQQELVEKIREHPWNLFTGTYQGEPIYWTKDEAAAPDQRVKAFPGTWPYLRDVLAEIHEGKGPILIEKPRRMFISYLVHGYALWDCLVHDAANWLVSKSKEEEAANMLRDKVKFPYSRLPTFLRQLWPMKSTLTQYSFTKTDAHMLGVAQNFGKREARGAGGDVIIDEAALQDSFQHDFESAVPMARRVICMTTPEIGVGARFFKAVLDGDVMEVEPEGDIIRDISHDMPLVYTRAPHA